MIPIIRFYFCVIIIFSISFYSFAWHADKFEDEDPSRTTCDEYKNISISPIQFLPNAAIKLNLWGGFSSSNGSVIFGFYEAIENVFNHQNPINCSDKKFVIVEQPFRADGFGSLFHVLGQMLSYALNYDRIMIWDSPSNLLDYVNISHCRLQGKHDRNTNECYFFPISNCSIEAALGKNASIASIPMVDISSMGNFADHRVIQSPERFKDYGQIHHFPDRFRRLLTCSPVRESNYYYWWRSVAAAYFIRPNKLTTQYLSRLTKSYLTSKRYADSDTAFSHNVVNIALHIRHGDKGTEMQLKSFYSYTNVSIDLLSRLRAKLGTNDTLNNLFISSEDPLVFEQGESWAKENKWNLFYTRLFDRFNDTDAWLDAKAMKSLNRPRRFHKYEVLSNLIDLQFQMKSDAWVCTLESNICRLIDELRSTIGGKANNLYADLTCSRGIWPCIGRYEGTFDW